jgi:hypothetical protein
VAGSSMPPVARHNRGLFRFGASDRYTPARATWLAQVEIRHFPSAALRGIMLS